MDDDIIILDDNQALDVLKSFLSKSNLFTEDQKLKLIAKFSKMAQTPGELAKLVNQVQIEYKQIEDSKKFDVIEDVIKNLEADPDFDQSKVQPIAEGLSNLSMDELQSLQQDAETTD